MSLTQKPRPGNFILTEEEGHLSRDNLTIKLDATNKTFDPGQVLKSDGGSPAKQIPWTGGATATGILMYHVNVETADQQAVVITRNAEVAYADLIMAADATSKLALLGIIVRK